MGKEKTCRRKIMKGRQMIIIVDDDKPGELLKCLFLESIKIRNYFDGINAF